MTLTWNYLLQVEKIKKKKKKKKKFTKKKKKKKKKKKNLNTIQILYN